MSKQKKYKNLSVFCSTSSSRLNEVNNLLIPSLEKQTYKGEINLSLLNYESNNKIKKEDIKGSSKLKIEIVNPDKPMGFDEVHNFPFNLSEPKKYFLITSSDICSDENYIKESIDTY